MSHDESVDPRKYYDLEEYLFETVGPRFGRKGFLSAFDLFSIIIWKSNRSKSKFAERLLHVAGTLDLEEAAIILTGEIASAVNRRDRFFVLTKEWGFRLPTATAILTVLFPEDFTVYDQRVCDQLNGFRYLADRTNFDNLWIGYLKFVDEVKMRVPEQESLRDKDRYLFGASMANQLDRQIKDGFKRKE